MPVTLAATINSTTRNLTLSGPLPDPAQGDLYLLEDELVEFYSYKTPRKPALLDTTKIVVTRGVAGTTSASHDSGTAVQAAVLSYVASADESKPDPVDSGGSGGVTVDNGSDPPAAVTRLVAPGADVSMPGTATLTQIVISTQDPGAIGAGNIWLNPDAAPGTGSDAVMLLVRDEADSEWYAVTGPSVIDPDGSSTLLIDGGDTTEIVYDGSRISLEAIGAKTPRIRLNGGFGLEIRDGEGNSGAPGQVLTVNADGSARWADLP